MRLIVVLVLAMFLVEGSLGRTSRRFKRLRKGDGNFVEGSGDSNDDDNEDDDDDDDDGGGGETLLTPPRREIPLVEPTPALPPHFRSSLLLRPELPNGDDNGKERENLLAGSGGGPDVNIYITPTPTFTQPPPTSTALPPRITRTYGKQILLAGVPFSLSLNKSVHFNSKGELELEAVDVPEWATFVNDNLAGLPTNQDVSEYVVTVRAVDLSTRLSVSQPLSLSVRQRQKSRLHNHFFTLEFNGNASEVYGKLEKFFGVKDANDVIVVEKNDFAAPPFSTTWLHDSQLGSNSCPVNGLKDLYSQMVAPGGELTPKFKNALKPVVAVGVELNVAGNCEGHHDDITGNVRTRPPSVNYPPSVKQIDEISCSAGKLLVFKVPESFCVDPEDPPSSLTLSLLDNDRRPTGDGWLQFDSKNREFFGLPSETDVGTHEFFLVCKDSGEKEASDALEVVVENSDAHVQYGAEFALHFDGGANLNGATQKRRFLERLANALGSTTKEIRVREFKEFQGIAHIKWVNASNPLSEGELSLIRRKFLSAEGGIERNFINSFAPEFTLQRATGSMVPLGPVVGAETPIYFEPEDPKINVFGGNELNENGGHGDNAELAYVVNFLLPGILMALMVLVALTVACLLARNTRSGSLKEREALKATVPVILFGEIENADDHLPQIQSNSKGEGRGVWVHPREQSPAPLPPSYSRDSYAAPPPLHKLHQHKQQRVLNPKQPAPSYIPP